MPRSISIMDDKKRDAQIEVESPSKRERQHWVGPSGGPVQHVRLVKGTETTTYAALVEAAGSPEALSQALVDGDPEVDLGQVGRRLTHTSRVYLGPEGNVLYVARVLKVVYSPEGEELSRDDFVDVEATVGEELPALPWTGRLMAIDEVIHRFAFVRKLQLRHVNGLTFDFLYEMAKTLEASGMVMYVGAGAKARQPLIFQTNGSPFRGFLEGRTEGESYKLVLHLSNLEIKRPVDGEEEGLMRWSESWAAWGGGKRAPVGSLADEELAKRLRVYKRQVAKRYRVVEPEAIERLLAPGEYWISTKLDGELWFLVKREGEVALCAFNGRVVRETPLLAEAERLLADAPDVVFAGELVATPPEHVGRARVHHVATAFGDEAEHTLRFHAFDVVEDDGKDALLSDYATRLERMRALLGGGERVGVVETATGDPKEVLRLYREWVLSDRFEGVVVRSDRGLTYKIKSTLTIDAAIIAYGERITGDVRQVREMSVALLRDDGTWQLLGAVGGGFSEQDRADWHARLSTLEVPSRFRLANREGTLSKFVRPEIVVEIRCSDLLATDSWDTQIRRMSLRFREDGGWEPLYETPTAVMIHPVFQRERADKTIDAGSIGMTQITSRVPLETPEGAAADAVPQASSEIVRRCVFTKTTKGLVAVRKYLVIDTHKGEEGSWPPYLVYFTDYSPGRKDALQTTLRTAASMASAEAHVVEWLDKNVKRGWGEVESARVGEPVDPPEAVQVILTKAKG